jgi:RNA-directed DNA polymerase
MPLSGILNKEQLAVLMGMTFKKHFAYYLHRIPEATRYQAFEIKKKGGGTRKILAPRGGLRTLQRRLAKLFLAQYKVRPNVHSYALKRSVITNAETHAGSKHILNIDLTDFFDSINFGRVRGMLMAQPYSANAEVATVMAQICCHKNKLPQGAPTSPIVSNMICARLDAQLRALARDLNCRVTRYCDDITFSTNQSKFPERIVTVEGVGDNRVVLIGPDIISIIEGNGFNINGSKTRLLSRSDRQDVTGLVTNKFTNINRKFIRNIRAALHAWEKFGLEAFQQKFAEEFYGGPDEAHAPDVRRVIQGRIQFVGQVRGFDDFIYVAFRDKYNVLAAYELKIPIHQNSWEYKRGNAVWVLEDLDQALQGTAFFAEGVGLISCMHCVGKKPYIYHPSTPGKKYPVTLVKADETVDLAILRLEPENQPIFTELTLDRSDNPRVEQEIVLAGYPNHGVGKGLRVEASQIASLMVRSGVKKFNITGSIPGGNSGGPVFDRRRRVIGVAVTGADHDEDHHTDERSVIRISMLQHLREVETREDSSTEEISSLTSASVEKVSIFAPVTRWIARVRAHFRLLR